MEKIYQTHTNLKKAGVAISISDRVAFREKNITKGKDGHLKMIKES